MARALYSTAAVLTIGVLMTACTSNPVQPRDDASIAPTPTQKAGLNGALPACADVTIALGDLVGDLEFNQRASIDQTTPEAYEQAVCVYTSADEAAQLGVTIAAIPFQQGEIDGYATLDNAIADDRLAQYSGVMQTLAPGDIDDGILNSALYLFDVTYSITIQGISVGEPITVTMPQLSVAAAIDGAFAVRALVG